MFDIDAATHGWHGHVCKCLACIQTHIIQTHITYYVRHRSRHARLARLSQSRFPEIPRITAVYVCVCVYVCVELISQNTRITTVCMYMCVCVYVCVEPISRNTPHCSCVCMYVCMYVCVCVLMYV